MLACARLGAIHSVVFGGFAAHELAVAHRRLPAEARRLGLVRHRAAAGWSSTSRCSTGRSSWRITRRSGASSSSARSSRPTLVPGPRRRLGRGDGRRGRRPTLRAGRGDRSALHPLHVRHDGDAEGHRARQRRPRRRAGVVDGRRLRRAARRGLLGGVGHRLGRRPLLHRLRAAAARLHDGPVRGQAGRHAGRRRLLAGLRRARGERAVHGADGDPGDQARGPARRSWRPATTCRRLRTLFLAGERCDPDTLHWAERAARARR